SSIARRFSGAAIAFDDRLPTQDRRCRKPPLRRQANMITFRRLARDNKIVESRSSDAALAADGGANSREALQRAPARTAEPLILSRNEDAPAPGGAPAAELIAVFEKQFPGGTVIKVELRRPADAFSLTILFGPSGVGKSTTLRCLAGLDRPERGAIRCGDEIWFDAERGIFLPPQRRRIGYLFQDYALFPHLRVAQNIGYGLGKIAAPERRERVGEITALLGLAGLEDHYPRQLS